MSSSPLPTSKEPSTVNLSKESTRVDVQSLAVEEPKDGSLHHLEGLALAVVMSGLLLSLFLPALDQLILSEFFHSLIPYVSIYTIR